MRPPPLGRIGAAAVVAMTLAAVPAAERSARAAPRAAAASSLPARDLHEVFARYARGERDIIWNIGAGQLAPIWTLADQIEEWPKSIAPPADARGPIARQVPAFAVEVARALGYQDPPTACRLLTRMRVKWLRPAEASSFTRAWHGAVLDVMLSNRCVKDAAAEADAAVTAFPTDPRLRLARGVIAAMSISQRLADGDTPSGRDVRDADSKFRIAMALAPVAAEAALRLGRLRAELGDHAQALTLFDAAGAFRDRDLRYLSHLFRGWSLSATGRGEDAGREYREALEVVPFAQSAALAEAREWFLSRDPDRADAAIAALTARPDPAADPWWTYPQGDGTLVDAAIVRMRQEIER